MKVLIYMDENEVISHGGRGGPLGVGYYIYNEAKRRKLSNIHFLNENSPSTELNKKKSIKDKLPKGLRNCLAIINRYRLYKKRFSSPKSINVDLNEFDVVHFHDSISLFDARGALKDYKGKVLFTSHSPVPHAQEKAQEMLTPFERKHLHKLYDRLPEMDEYSFTRADYIVFPCPEAEEPYFDNWEEYKTIKEKKCECYRYATTGISPKTARLSRDEVRKKYGINNHDFVLSYAGRHNQVKGYDKLKEFAKRLFDSDKSIKVIAAGREVPLTRLEHPQWIEIGFTKDPHSIIAASDIYVLPNKETYFDLVMIEVLSLGKIVVASRTGGNKYFEKNNVEGVLLYDTDEEAISLINKVKKMSVQEREKLEQANLDFYQKHLTDKAFFDSYYAILKEIEQA